MCLITTSKGTNSKWRYSGIPDCETKVNCLFSLQLQNLDKLDALTEDLTTPGSVNYRNWKTIEELNEITKPDPKQTLKLHYWLSEHQLSFRNLGDFIKVSGSVHSFEKAFDVEYRSFINHKKEIIHRSTTTPKIPKVFDGFIDFITGISEFPVPPKQQQIENVATSDYDVKEYYMVPQTLRTQYQMSNITAVASTNKSSQGVVEFSSQYGIIASDLTVFMNLTDGDINAALNYTVGPFVANDYSEASLDVQYIMAMAPGVPTSCYVVDGWIIDFVALISQRALDNEHIPSVFSISFGWAESQQCDAPTGNGCGQYTNTEYVEKCDVGFQKMGLMGISVFVSSGDAGTAATCFREPYHINPSYPASSKFVTSVGGTMYSKATKLSENIPPFCADNLCAGFGTEITCSTFEAAITSGGGFSNITSMPEWQTSQVENYLNSAATLPLPNMYNAQGRGFPDISALAHRYMIVLKGRSHAIDGTSASSPVVAGMFAMINDYLLDQGENTIGFLNPTLYSAYSVNNQITNDITVGYNGPHIEDGPCSEIGFGSYPGWDATTGLGTPNYSVLLSAFAP